MIGANSLWGAFILSGRYAANGQESELINAASNVALTALCGFALWWEFQQETISKDNRKRLRERQIAVGDRQVYSKLDTGSGRVRTFSKLKPVDADWIIRRIDRWGLQETVASGGKPLPTVGPAKGALLEELVREYRPMLVVDVGSFIGYAAIRMARSQPPGGRTITIEKDLVSHLTAKRFVWQSRLWRQYPWEDPPEQTVECWFGDALQTLPQVAAAAGPADLIFIDGRPAEYADYLAAAERCGLVRGGTVVVADNVGIFEGSEGVKQYLGVVRGSGRYESRTLQSTLEYRDDTPDAMEVSVCKVVTSGPG